MSARVHRLPSVNQYPLRPHTKWSPTQLPKLKKQWLQGFIATQARRDALEEQVWEAHAGGSLTEQEAKDRISLIRRSERRGQKVRAKFEDAGLWWVTKEMTAVAMDASQDLPWVNWNEVLPSESGVIGFAQELPGVHTPEPLPLSNWYGVLKPPFPVDALGWWRSARGELNIEVIALADRLGGQMQGGPFQQVLTLRLDLETSEHDDFRAVSWVSKGSREANAIEGRVRASHTGVRALLATALSLINQPQVSATSLLDVGKRDATEISEPERATRRPKPTDVLLIDARPPQPAPDEDPSETPGRFQARTHRWVVRGHWRNQAYGPGGSLRRQKWIPDHIRGPEGAPLLQRERVYVWRR